MSSLASWYQHTLSQISTSSVTHTRLICEVSAESRVKCYIPAVTLSFTYELNFVHLFTLLQNVPIQNDFEKQFSGYTLKCCLQIAVI